MTSETAETREPLEEREKGMLIGTPSGEFDYLQMLEYFDEEALSERDKQTLEEIVDLMLLSGCDCKSEDYNEFEEDRLEGSIKQMLRDRGLGECHVTVDHDNATQIRNVVVYDDGGKVLFVTYVDDAD